MSTKSRDYFSFHNLCLLSGGIPGATGVSGLPGGPGGNGPPGTTGASGATGPFGNVGQPGSAGSTGNIGMYGRHKLTSYLAITQRKFLCKIDDCQNVDEIIIRINNLHT